jgi:multiple sugar transport system ATP-binding protein
MASIALEGVTKRYANGVVAVRDLTLEVEDGEFVVLVGPSGCGKTTTLRMVAGLEDVTEGTIRFGDRVVNSLSPKERDVAMVFQNYALYPHMTVRENIGFALKLAGMPKAEREQRVQEAARILGLEQFLDRKPAQLSGGQRQRVAMGRAIVREPNVFLMDEPLSNLDAKLRVQMRAEVLRIQRRIGVAALYVTHDQVEAMTMGDRVAVLHRGELQQYADPQTLYRSPANLFVAAFIGSPAMNLYHAQLVRDEGLALELGGQRVRLDGLSEQHPELADRTPGAVIVGVRPEALGRLVEPGTHGALTATIELVEELGSEKLVHFRIDAKPFRLDVDDEDLEPAAGLAGAGAEGVARVDAHVPTTVGGTVGLAIDAEAVYLFDPESAAALR